MIEEVLSVRHYRAGYELRTVLCKMNDEEKPITLKKAYTPEGNYIGNSKWAHRLIIKRGIKPEKASADHNVCSIGFCERDQKWFGWSHRAIAGFGVGSVVKEGDCCASSGWIDEYLIEHPEADLSLPVGFEAATLEDCRRMAIAFADSVG